MVLMQIAGFKERPGFLTIARRGEDDFTLPRAINTSYVYDNTVYWG